MCKTLLRLTQQQLRHNFNWIFLGALVPQHLYFMNPFIPGPLKISYFSHHVYAHFITTLMHEWYLMWLFYYCHLTPCPTFTAENNFSKIVGIGETVSAESDFDRTLVSHEILKFRKKKIGLHPSNSCHGDRTSSTLCHWSFAVLLLLRFSVVDKYLRHFQT